MSIFIYLEQPSYDTQESHTDDITNDDTTEDESCNLYDAVKNYQPKIIIRPILFPKLFKGCTIDQSYHPTEIWDQDSDNLEDCRRYLTHELPTNIFDIDKIINNSVNL